MSDMVLGKEGIPEAVTALAEQIKQLRPGDRTARIVARAVGTAHPDARDMPGMDHGAEAMEGMMSEEDMQALSEAQGTEAAHLFLTQMIAHHKGAVDMAQTEIEDGQFPDAVEMARTIVAAQEREIETMRQLLTTL